MFFDGVKQLVCLFRKVCVKMGRQINCDWTAALLEHLLGWIEHENEIQSDLKNAPVLIGYESIGWEQLFGSVGQIKFRLTNFSPNWPTQSFKSIFSPYTASTLKVLILFKLSNTPYILTIVYSQKCRFIHVFLHIWRFAVQHRRGGNPSIGPVDFQPVGWIWQFGVPEGQKYSFIRLLRIKNP